MIFSLDNLIISIQYIVYFYLVNGVNFSSYHIMNHIQTLGIKFLSIITYFPSPKIHL